MRFSAVGASALLAVGTAAALATPASAATQLGTLTLPTTGAASTAFSITTSGACPSGSTYSTAVLNGPAGPTGPAWSNITVVGNNNSVNNQAGPFSEPLGDTLAGFAQGNGLSINPTGKYDFTLFCQNSLGSVVTGQYTGSIWFNNAGAAAGTQGTTFQNTDPAAVKSTTTTVSAPATSGYGSSVTISATVTPSTAPGTVTFKDGSTSIGSPVTVSAGSASVSTSSLPAGARSITAVFTPTNGPVFPAAGYTPQYASSTSTPTTVAVSQAGTTITLTENPASGATTADNVTLTGTISPSAATGTCDFQDNGTSLGTGAVSGGVCTLSLSNLPAKTYQLVAIFTPTAGGNYSGSNSGAAQSYVVTTFSGVSTSQTVVTTVVPGSLLISVATDAANSNAQNLVTLANPVINTAGDLFTTSGDMIPVVLTDTRAGDPGYSVTGSVSDFVGSANAAHKINGQDLGWAPKSGGAKSTHVTPTFATATAPAAVEGGVAMPASGVSGLKGTGAQAAPLATTPSHGGTGTLRVGATLNLNVPTDTPADTYTATLTVTAI